jgi:hypothetical protein
MASRLINFLRVILVSVGRWIDVFFPWKPVVPVPAITSVTPSGGWPGTILTIEGIHFGEARDDNVVNIGGARALVITASATRLLVLAGEDTVSGKVEVATSKGTGVSAMPFIVLPVPDSRDATLGGPPVFFHGPQPGTPRLHVPDQPVLVLLTYPTDHDPGAAVARAAARTAEIAQFENARRFWQQASYGSTSWRFDYTQWLPLPANRDYYTWQPDDVYDARRRLFGETKRAAVMHNGFVLATHRDDSMATVNVTAPGGPTSPSYTSVRRHGTGIRVRGSRAFVATGATGFSVFDLNNSPATVVRHVATSGWCCDLDIVGDTLVIAALGGGLLVYDISITANPVLRGSLAFPSAAGHVPHQASAVRVAGTRAFVGVDTTVQVVDIMNPAAPAVIASVDVGAYVMDLAIDGSTLAVATDGKGISLVDVAPATPVIRSTILAAPRVHGVFLSAGRLFAACGEAGVKIFEATNPAAPITRGSLATTHAAYAVIAHGPSAYVSLGRRHLAVVDVADLNNPQLRGSTLMGAYLGGTSDPDLPGLRASVDVAVQEQNLAQRWGALWFDALTAARSAGWNLDLYKGIVIVVNGPFLRGASSVGDQVIHEDTGRTFKLNESKGRYYVARGATWGRIAHETGHWLGMWDIYTEAQADGTLLQGPAQTWCISGSSDAGPLFCAHQIHEIMKFYSPAAPAAPVAGLLNVVERKWSPTAPPLDETFDIVAHDSAQNTDPNRTHVVKLEVASGLIYFLEVRQRPAGLIFDQNLVGTDPATGGAVVVTKAAQGTTITNTFERPITLFGVLFPGQQVVDAARGLTIRCESIVQNVPLVCRVRVRWNQPVAGDPNGQFDMTITPWNTDLWETVDIWVDSERNGFGIYENSEKGRPDLPVRNGDRPWVGRRNMINARIRNTGPQAVNDVFVSFYATSPPGIGDNGNWALLGTEQIPTLPGRDPGVPGSGDLVVQREWSPEKNAHTCLKVAIFPQPGEVEPNNNSAQENVFTFDSPGSSSHDPVLIDAVVRSPFTVWKRIDSVVRGLPAGWHAVIDHAWVWTGPKGERAVRAVIWTDLNAPYSSGPPHFQRRIEPRALARIEGWTTFDHRYIPIGGILADVKATRKVRINWEAGGRGNRLGGGGCLDPGLPDVPITIEITSQGGERIIAHLRTDARGCFDLGDIADLRLNRGTYRVQAFVAGGAAATETESEPRQVEIS